MKYNRPKLDWFETVEGKDYINKYIPHQYDWIERNYHNMPNTENENCGIYGIFFNEVCVYIGESSQIAHRWTEHIYNMKSKPLKKWGLAPNDIGNNKVTVRLQIIEDGLIEKGSRLELESKYIEKFSPILQLTIDAYYPYDKAEKRGDVWLPRDEVRLDQCIKEKYRREVISKVLKI